jgi:hypothetical protein
MVELPALPRYACSYCGGSRPAVPAKRSVQHADFLAMKKFKVAPGGISYTAARA